MKKYLVVCLLSAPSLASEPFSLFLTEEEQSRFNKDVNLGVLTQNANRLSLKAVMMMDEDNWTVWLNDLKITPDACPPYIQVRSVTPTSVDVVWSKNREPVNVFLNINEAMDLDQLEETEEQ